jgi:hypothetical protein
LATEELRPIADNYSEEELIGRQVLAVVNFPVKVVAGTASEAPDIAVTDGLRVL